MSFSSLRVPDMLTSIAGQRRSSASCRLSTSSMLPVPLNSSKITWSWREPVSMSAVATIVSEPPSSMFRAAPKKAFGRSRARESMPPDMVRPPPRCSRLNCRPRRVSESMRMTTSLPVSTRRLAFFRTISVTRTWFSGVWSFVETATSPCVARCMAVASSGRSSMSNTSR